MNLDIGIIPVSDNGKYVVSATVTNSDTGESVKRNVTVSHVDDLDGFTGEVETTFGSEAAGTVRAKLEQAAKDRPMPKTGGPTIEIITAGKLVDDHPAERPYLISGLCRQAETVNIVASPKTYKSFLALAIALCVCTGRALFGMFQTRKSRVLYIDNELHKETFSHRIPKVAGALGVLSSEWRDELDVVSLRGHLADINQLDSFFRSIVKGKYGLIVLDALYRLWPEGCDENSNSDVTKVYNVLDKYAEMTGATIIIIHHSSKGIQGGKAVTDTGSGAGAQSRAADGHWVIRQHEEKDCAVLDAVLRSWAPIEPLGLRWTYPVWTPDLSLDVTKLKRERGPGGRPPKDKAAEPKPESTVWTPETFVAEFITATAKPREAIESAANRRGLAFRTIAGLIAEAELSGLVFQHPKQGSNAKFYANREPEIFDGAQGVCLSHTPPSTPKARRVRDTPAK
jgi:hypothetical protein